MIQYDETRLAMEALTPQIEELRGALNLDGIKIKLDELEMKTTEPGFWDDPEKSQAILQQIGQYKSTISGFEKLRTNHEEVLTMIELAEEEQDGSMEEEAKALAQTVTTELEEQKLATLLTGEYDSCNAILSFHAGAGGTEAQDWVSMLLRMYTKWADHHGFKVELLDQLDGDEAGIKSASIQIQGYNAYGFLKSEHGVCRRASLPSKSCLKSKRTFRLRYAPRILRWKCTVQAARAVSTSTKRPLRYALSTSPRAS